MKIVMLLVLTAFCMSLLGCGETVSGIGKDTGRIGKGIKTIFIREEGK